MPNLNQAPITVLPNKHTQYTHVKFRTIRVINMFQMRNSVLFCYKTCACNKSWAGSQRLGLPAFRDGVPFIALRCHMILYDALLWCYLVLFQDGSPSAWCSDMCLKGNIKSKYGEMGPAFYCPPDDTCRMIFEAKMVWWNEVASYSWNGVCFHCPHKIIPELPFTVHRCHMLSPLWTLSSLDQLV